MITCVPNGSGVVGAVENINAAGIASFKAGDSAAIPDPEPATIAGGLALFALGAVGVCKLRRRQQQATA